MEQSDFMLIDELSRRTRRKVSTLYDDFQTGSGPFASILTKLGNRLGCWRADYEILIASQRRLADPLPLPVVRASQAAA